MTPLNKFILEFPVTGSPKLLYNFISTPEGLSRWFADKVDIIGDEYLFSWEGSQQSARLAEFRECEFVRYEWTDDFHEGFTLEMQINHQPVSGEAALVISDYAEASDIEFTQRWWVSQVARLQRLFSNTIH
jgi:uncharacterized protein YndB with AHSA1/START domain